MYASHCIIGPHHSITYIDAVCCYRLSLVVGLCVTLVSPAKTAELIEMQFWLRILVCPGNHTLQVQIPHGKGQFKGVVKYGGLCRKLCKSG